MTRCRQLTRLAVPMLLAAVAANAVAIEPTPSSMAGDPMYMAVYGPGERVAAIDVQRLLPAAPPVAFAAGGDDDRGDYALIETPRKNPFHAGGTGD